MRNATTTTIAPTGTISIIAGCSGGIEPVFSPAFLRHVLEGETLVEVNPIFERRLTELGLYSPEVLQTIAKTGSVRAFPQFPQSIREVFVSARDVSPEWHVRMQAAAQAHVDSAVSKTVNFPEGATALEVGAVFRDAFGRRLKGITVYRDGSRRGQPMALAGAPVAPPAREPISTPEIMPCVRVRQRTPFGNLHAKISVDPAADRELEVFAQLGKAGDLASSDLEAICRLLSLFLRLGGTLPQAVDQLRDIGSSLSVPTKEGRILSLGDGLARALDRYLAAKARFGLKALLLGEADPAAVPVAPREPALAAGTRYQVKCPECDGSLVFEEGCARCHSCGFSQC
jgi:ribonucleoside-diphosphate reductase alpha chain